jgi:hypothetical protein
MGIATFPAASGGLSSVVKSVQRGSAGSAGNVTITAVDIAKSMVNIFGTASSGTIAATGSISGASGNAAATNGTAGAQNGNISRVEGPYGGLTRAGSVGISMGTQTLALNAQSISLNATNISGGSNNLVAAVVQGYLANSTTLTVSGACRYEVVEFF